MTLTVCRWSLLLGVALIVPSCTEPRGAMPEPPHVSPDAPRLVVVIAPGLDEDALSGSDTPNLDALPYALALVPSAPAHPEALWATLHSGLPPTAHGVFDGTLRQPSSYERVGGLSVERARVQSGVVRPPRFANTGWPEPFWGAVSNAGVPMSVLFAPRAMPPLESKTRFLAGRLPAVTGEVIGPTLFVADVGADEQTLSNTVDQPLAELAPGEAPPEPAPRPEPPSGITPLEPLSTKAWRAKVPITVTAVDGTDSVLVGSVVVRELPGRVSLELGDKQVELSEGERSPYSVLTFRSGSLELRGVIRLHLLTRDPLRLLVEPASVDPYEPAFAVSTPREFVATVAGRAGPGSLVDGSAAYRSALGLVDPSFRLKRIVEDCQWQTGALIAELESSPSRVLIVYLDVLERARALAEPRGEPAVDEPLDGALRTGVEALDAAVRKVRALLDERDTMVVLSPFVQPRASRSVDLNAWLEQKRYLRRDRDGAIDWSKTQAYAAGQGGIYLNITGREPKGSVAPLKAQRLAKRIARDVERLRDGPVVAVQRALLGDDLYGGSRRADAPDVVVAMAPGYVASGSARVQGAEIISDVTEPRMSAPLLGEDAVGRVLSSRPIAVTEPRLEDLAATARAFGGLAQPREAGDPWFAPASP